MDWVETTGKSVDEATDRALAHLGVHRDDAEIEVIEEPKAGMFGRVRGEARVRARVRPSGPRPKRSRRSTEDVKTGPATVLGMRSPEFPGRLKPTGVAGRRIRPRRTASEAKFAKRWTTNRKNLNEEDTMAEGISLAEQGPIAKEFLEGLLESMNIKAEVSVKELDAGDGGAGGKCQSTNGIGILVGPRGTTLQALQEVTRTVVQSKSPSRTDRILVDVAQYRERRVAALAVLPSRWPLK